MTESEAARREEYRRRQTRHQERAAAAGRLEERISGARLSVVLSGLLIGWLALSGTRLSPWWLVAPAAAFAALLVVHESVRGRRRQAERRSAFYQRGLARLDGHWA